MRSLADSGRKILTPAAGVYFRRGSYELAREGNTAEALRVYDERRTRLHDDLGAAPSTQTQELHNVYFLRRCVGIGDATLLSARRAGAPR